MQYTMPLCPLRPCTRRRIESAVYFGTVSGDDDAVDCFVLTTLPLAAGTTIECDPVGLLEQIEDGEVFAIVQNCASGEAVAFGGHGLGLYLAAQERQVRWNRTRAP